MSVTSITLKEEKKNYRPSMKGHKPSTLS